MFIQSYEMALSSYRKYEQRDTFTEELREWGPENEDEPETPPAADAIAKNRDRISLSDAAFAAFKSQAIELTPQLESAEFDPEEEIAGDAKLMTLKKMIEFLTGKKINLTRFFEDNNEPVRVEENSKPEAPNEVEQTEAEAEQEWGMSYSSYQSHYEYESTEFSASGVVKTADGKEIEFSLDLAMSREYFTEERFEITAGTPLIDPLVINYSGKAAELSDMKFEFDLDADGHTDEINYINPGSGFLVFDKNEDGKINDGSEMFGPSTGNGFNELSAYDDDKNNWIDENDAIYSKLALWHKGENVDILTNLKESDVGAIYLGSVKTQFDVKNHANELYGRIQSAGVYLSEEGKAGSVQQIDFAL